MQTFIYCYYMFNLLYFPFRNRLNNVAVENSHKISIYKSKSSKRQDRETIGSFWRIKVLFGLLLS